MTATLLSCLILSTSLVSANKIEKGFCSKLGLLKMNCKKTKENPIGCNLNTVHRLMILLFPHGKQKSFELPANPGLLKNAPRISDSVSHPSTEAWRLGTLHSSPGIIIIIIKREKGSTDTKFRSMKSLLYNKVHVIPASIGALGTIRRNI